VVPRQRVPYLSALETSVSRYNAAEQIHVYLLTLFTQFGCVNGRVCVCASVSLAAESTTAEVLTEPITAAPTTTPTPSGTNRYYLYAYFGERRRVQRR